MATLGRKVVGLHLDPQDTKSVNQNAANYVNFLDNGEFKVEIHHNRPLESIKSEPTERKGSKLRWLDYPIHNTPDLFIEFPCLSIRSIKGSGSSGAWYGLHSIRDFVLNSLCKEKRELVYEFEDKASRYDEEDGEIMEGKLFSLLRELQDKRLLALLSREYKDIGRELIQRIIDQKVEISKKLLSQAKFATVDKEASETLEEVLKNEMREKFEDIYK